MKLKDVAVVSLPALMIRRDSPYNSSLPSGVLGVWLMRCSTRSGFFVVIYEM
jgi:hypothetical protein